LGGCDSLVNKTPPLGGQLNKRISTRPPTASTASGKKYAPDAIPL
jgi:hypothetical protein